MQSLGDYLNSLPDHETLVVDEAIDRDYVMSSLVMGLQRDRQFPVVHFKNVSGNQIPVVANLFASEERVADMIGSSIDGYVDKVNSALMSPTKPIEPDGEAAPCQEDVRTGEDVDVRALPISRHFTDDAGRYVSSGILVAKDPDTGIRNLSFQRMQLKGPRRFGVSLHSRGHIWDYQRRAQEQGRDLEVAVIIGSHPALYLAASARVGMEVDEYDIAGALMSDPVQLTKCKTLDLEVPAQAEIVLEGRILANVDEPEGPFGEYTGYSSSRSTNNVFEVDAVTHRREPIYLDLVPGNSRDHLGLGQSFKRPYVLSRVRERVPQVQDLAYPHSGSNYHAYLKMDKSAEGQARLALMLLMGTDSYVKLAVAVGADIDIHNESEVMWAIATKVQADRDTFIVPKVFHNRLDPSGEDGLSAKMGIDATGSPSNAKVPRISSPTAAAETADRIRRIWSARDQHSARQKSAAPGVRSALES